MHICHTYLAFADDTGYICKYLKELNITIDCLERWSEENRIPINRKKSGILIINHNGIDGNVIIGFPVVTEYNYLGVLVGTKLKPCRHVAGVRKKLKIYLSKN